MNWREITGGRKGNAYRGDGLGKKTLYLKKRFMVLCIYLKIMHSAGSFFIQVVI